MSRRRPKTIPSKEAGPARRAGPVVLALAAVLVTVAALEALTVAGVDYRAVFRTPVDYEYSAVVRFDPELLFITRPHLHETGSHRGGDIAMAWHIRGDEVTESRWNVRLDRNGFRNPDSLTTAPVCVLGDSFVVADHVAEREMMTVRLGERLGVPVANLGQIGYGPQQELAVLRRFAFAYPPKVVLWLVYEGNDLRDAAWYESVRRAWPDLVARQRAFAQRSLLANAAAAARRLGEPEPPEAPVARTRWGRLPDGRRMWFLNPAGPWAEWQLAALEVLGDVLAEGQRVSAAHGSRLAVVFVPDKFRVYRDVCVFPEHSECRTWQPNDFPDRLQGIVRRMTPEVGFLDLTTSLRERARAGALLYPPDDTHWSPAGNAAVADVLAAYLRERALLE